ncbi:MAG: hypothetical protein IKY07_04355, partial [Clostridia bacterium]|nr:hypothetical protein [Clostridia bacterium]
IVDYEKNPDADVVFPKGYVFTLDDLCTALKNIAAENPVVEELYEEWFYQLLIDEDAFGIPVACGTEGPDGFGIESETGDGHAMDENKENSPISLLPVKETDMFREIWFKLEDIWGRADFLH